MAERSLTVPRSRSPAAAASRRERDKSGAGDGDDRGRRARPYPLSTRHGRGEADVDLEAAAGTGARGHEGVVRVGNRVNDCEAETETVRVAPLERLEEARKLPVRDQRPGIGDRENSPS